METAIRNKEVAGKDAPANTAEAKLAPVKVIRDGDVSASVFARTRGERTYYSVSFSRSFKSTDGTTRYAKSFDAEDLAKVVAVAKQADDYVRNLTQEA